MTAMNTRRIGLAITVVAVLAFMWLVHLVRVRREARRRGAAQVAAAEVMLMAPYQRDLRIGMTKEQVEEYLGLRHAAFLKADHSAEGFTYKVKIGEEKGDGIVCDGWYVYAAMDFDSTNKLSKIYPVRVGHCL